MRNHHSQSGRTEQLPGTSTPHGAVASPGLIILSTIYTHTITDHMHPIVCLCSSRSKLLSIYLNGRGNIADFFLPAALPFNLHIVVSKKTVTFIGIFFFCTIEVILLLPGALVDNVKEHVKICF